MCLELSDASARLSSRSVAVDATPHGAVVRIPAQAIRFVEVVRIGLQTRRGEYGRPLRNEGLHGRETLMREVQMVTTVLTIFIRERSRRLH